MSTPSNNETTLKAFDMVLAISEEAINNQLELLYNTPAKSVPLPVPGTSQPVTDYLIKRDVSMHAPEYLPDGSLVTFQPPHPKAGEIMLREDGVDGWIYPPRVELLPRKSLKAQLFLKFRSNPNPNPGSDEPTKSVYTYWVGRGRNSQKHEVELDEWSVSWEADLSSEDIHSLQEDLVALPGETVDKLRKYVNNQNYMVSSIFCMMQSATIVSTLRLYDKEGTEQKMGWGAAVASDLAAWLDAGKKSSTPTPKNPFVLGYGIRFMPPPEYGVPLFQPRYFQYSTSANDKSGNTLNFCMKTRNSNPVNMFEDGNAGNFSPSPMQKMAYKQKEADGVMVISNGLLFTEFIMPRFVEKIHLGKNKIDYAELVQEHINKDTFQETAPRIETKIDVSPLRGYRACKQWKALKKPYNTSLKGMLLQARDKWSGWENFEIRISSDPIPEENHDLNVHRRVYITVMMQHYVRKVVDTNTRGALIGTWSAASDSRIWVNLVFRFRIASNTEGTWHIELDRENSVFPQEIGDELQWTEKEPESWPESLELIEAQDRTQYSTGLFSWGKKSGVLAVSSDAGLSKNLKQLKNFETQDLGSIDEKLQEIQELVAGKVIMPAGNVFSFKGLNVDENGNLYSGVTYNSMTVGERFVPR